MSANVVYVSTGPSIIIFLHFWKSFYLILFCYFSFNVFLDSSCWGFTWIFTWNTWVLWSSNSLFCVRHFWFCHSCYTDTMNNGKVSLFYVSRRRINDMEIKCPLMLQSGSQKVWWTDCALCTNHCAWSLGDAEMNGTVSAFKKPTF